MHKPSNLEKLMCPRGIAVIGATEKPGRPGRIILEMLKRSGCALYPVHPRADKILGHPAYRRLEDIPRKVDIAVIAINAIQAVEAAEKAAAQAIPFIVVVAGGFKEAGAEGRLLEERLGQIPSKTTSRILGPNTLGLFLPHRNLDMIFVEHGDTALAGGGGVAFISQSGSVGVEALGLASNTGFGMRAFVGLGNKCDLDELDFLTYFANDPGTRCIACYTESLDTGRDFLALAGRAAAEKPLVILKAGGSHTGAAAAASHTGQLAGSDRIVSDAFRQFGIQRAMDDEALCDAAKVLSTAPLPEGNRVAILSAAGGYGVMGADRVEQIRTPVLLKMGRLDEATCTEIQSISHPFASSCNPIDLTAGADNHMFGLSLDALLRDKGVDIIICVAFFAPPSITDGLVDEIVNRTGSSPKPIIVFTQYGPYTDGYLKRFHDAGVVGYPSISRAVRAARFLVERSEFVRRQKHLKAL